MKKFVCTVCGYIYEWDNVPQKCPVCNVSSEKFEEMKWANEHRIGVAVGVDEEILEGLRANFVGECTEVGMYLAMSRQADKEGFPEVAKAYKRIAFEETEHAAKFTELLGLNSIHDTVHEMCKDEARHGKSFLGLLERYFKK